MPHHVSPPLEPAMAIQVAGSSGIPPSQEEVASLLNTTFTADTSQGALDAAYALTNLLITTTGFRGLASYGILSAIKKAAADKKSGAKRESAMILLGALVERFPPAQPLSEIVFLLQDTGLVPLAFDALADKGSVVRESAEYAIEALYNNLKPEALISGFLPMLSSYLEKRSGKWQGTVGAYKYLGKMADKAKMGTGSKEEERQKDILRESMGRKLESLIPIVELGMHDLKAEVCILH
jgi:elongation factor 3